MSIINAIHKINGESRSLDQLARLPQNLIMQMVQNKEIKEEDLAPILSRKAQIADDIAKAQALQAGADQPKPTVMDTLMAKNAMAENPMPQQSQQMPQQMPQQMDPSMMAQQMPQAPEEAGVGQLPIPERTYAGGGIIAFADGGLSDDEENTDRTLIERDMAKRASKSIDGLMAGIKNIPSQIHELYTKIPKYSEELSKFAGNVPKAYESAKTEVSHAVNGAKDSFLSKIEHLESRGKEYDKYGNVLTSPKGAKGSMQVMDKTNLDPGFGVKPAQDNSLEERARVGRDYALALKDHFNGNEKLAAMAYNWGPGNVKKWLASNGSLPIPGETKKYSSHFAEGGYIPRYSGADGINYVDLYGNKVNVPMGYDDEEETTPKSKTEQKYKETPRKTIEEVLNPKKPAGPQNPFKTESTAGVTSLLPRRGGDEYSNVYPVGGAGPLGTPAADASYLNQLQMEAKKDPSYQPIQDEINNLLKKNPNLANVVQEQNKMTSQPAKVENKPATVNNQPSVDKNAMVDQYLNEYFSNQRPQGKPPTQAQKSADETYFEKIMARDAEERKRIHSSAQEDKNLALLAAGLGIMGGTSPYAFANIGQGAMQGVQALAASKGRRAAELTALGKMEANTAWQQESMKDRAVKNEILKASQLRDDFAKRENDIRAMVTKMAASNPRISALPPEQQQAMINKQIQDALSNDQYYSSLASQLGFTPRASAPAPVLNYNQKSRSVG